MNGLGVQWRGGIFIFQLTSLKMTVLLHKTALVNFPMGTTVKMSFLRHNVKMRCHPQNLKFTLFFLAKKHHGFCELKSNIFPGLLNWHILKPKTERWPT